jgi:hypothetical protein
MRRYAAKSARIGGELEAISRTRTVRIVTAHEQYRRTYIDEVRGLINGTDYLLDMANPSAHHSRAQTGLHQSRGRPDLDRADVEIDDGLLFRDARLDRRSSAMRLTNTKLASASPDANGQSPDANGQSKQGDLKTVAHQRMRK